MDELVQRCAYDESDLRRLLRLTQKVDLPTMEGCVRRHTLPPDLADDERGLAHDRYRKSRGTYERHKASIQEEF